MDYSKLFQVVEEVESGGNPQAVSPKGAVGPMQTMPTTLTSPGYGVAPAKDNSVEEKRRVGQDYLKAMLTEYGDMPTALAAYNWGPGNVNEWRKSGADPAKLPKETRDYIAKIVPRVAGSAKEIAAASTQAAFAKRVSGVTDQAARDANYAADAQATRNYVEDRPSFLEMAGAAMAGSTGHVIVNALTAPSFAREAGFKPDLTKIPKGYDSDLVEAYAAAGSQAEADHVIAEWQDEQRRMQTVANRGTATAIALQFGAEGVDPVNWVVPFAATKGLARLGAGSDALFAAGRTGEGMVSSIGENLVSGTALEAIKQGVQGEFKPQDLAISLVADSLMGAGVGWLGARSAASRAMDNAGKTAIERELSYVARAEAVVGKGADADTLRKAMDDIYRKDANESVTTAIADVPDEHKLVVPDKAQAVTDLPNPDAVQVANDMEADFGTVEKLVARREDFSPGGKYASEISNRTGGTLKTIEDIERQGPGVKIHNLVLSHKPAVDTIRKLADKFLKDTTLVFSSDAIPLPDGRKANADIMQLTPNAAIIRIDPSLPAGEALRAGVHEVGHAIFNKHIAKIAPDQRARLAKAFLDFADEANRKTPNGDTARDMRFSLTNSSRMAGQSGTPNLVSNYDIDWDEFSAEQFVKYIEGSVNQGKDLGLHASVIRMFREAISNAIAWLKFAKRQELGVTNPYKEFFDNLLTDPVFEAVATAKTERKTLSLKASQMDKPADVVNELQADPDLVRFGLSTAPMGTVTERKHLQAMLALHKKAAVWAEKNPMDADWIKRADNLADNNVFNVASIGLTMLKSPSPLVRMLASELVEDASGVAGKRRATAAISKYITERLMMGNAVNDVQGAYARWVAGKPGAHVDNWNGGKYYAEFNKLVASEIEARRLAGGPVSSDGNINGAVESIQAAYQRSANEQRRVGTLGAEGLPTSSVGYMPHKMSARAVIGLTNDKLQVLHSALVDQFVTIEGWDMSFSDKLASSYLKRMRDKAGGDYSTSIGGQAMSTDLEEALMGMDLPPELIKKHMDKFNKGAAGFTKGRIDLDLNKVYETPSGEFRLLDLFETDQIELLRSQVGRASGEVALTKFGIRGKPGLKLLRDAMSYGEDGAKAGVREQEAFDQMAAEFYNEPFGTASGKWMDRAMQANTLVRLGGIVFNQLAESINGIFHVGAARAMDSIVSIPRLRAEIIALSKGEAVDNPFLSSIELAGGAEFGTDAYKFVMPFDSPDHAYPTYGKETLTLTDRLLRGGGHLQAKLSGWRMIHSAQQRGMAEQIVHKMMRYVREGKDDVALEQFGVNERVRGYLRDNLAQVADFDASGNLTRFDATKIADPDIREEVIQAVWRGTSQIIQGTYIGEKGKWAHDGWTKLLTQFRTFGLTSMEKQWGRQRNSHGTSAAVGMLVGSMALAAPVYMARTYAASVGRDDQAAFLEERLQPQMIARATLNYVAMSGMAGDFIDLTTAALPADMGIKPTGGRAGVESEFVGTFVAPASSLVDDIWKYAQSPLETNDALKIAPFSRLPFMVPAINALKE